MLRRIEGFATDSCPENVEDDENCYSIDSLSAWQKLKFFKYPKLEYKENGSSQSWFWHVQNMLLEKCVKIAVGEGLEMFLFSPPGEKS